MSEQESGSILTLWGGAVAGVSPDEDQLPFSADVAEAPPPGGAGLASPDLPSPRGGRGCTTRVTHPCIQSHRGPKAGGAPSTASWQDSTGI